MKNKAQHTIPRAYLERFTESPAPLGREPALWVAERGEGEPYQKAPKNAEVRSYYYTYVTPDGTREDAADELLQKLESAGLPVLRKLDQGADPANLTDEERAYSSHFLGTLAVRVPRFRETVETFVEDVARQTTQLGASHKEYFENTMKKAMAAAGRPMPENVEAVRQFVLSDEYKIKVDPLFSLQHMIRLAPMLAEYAYNYRWRVLEAPPESEFVTSDQPLVLVSTLKQPAIFGLGAGWESPWMEATLPLSPSSLLMISRHHPEGREVASPEAVAEANLRTATFATRVYSRSRVDAAKLNRPMNWEWWQPLSGALIAPLTGAESEPRGTERQSP